MSECVTGGLGGRIGTGRCSDVYVGEKGLLDAANACGFFSSVKQWAL
jgi:hypothetical protein